MDGQRSDVVTSTRLAAGALAGCIAGMGGPIAAGEVPIPAFSDQTEAAGLVFEHDSIATPGEPGRMTPGLAAADLDRDGWIDLLVQGGTGQRARLFINDRDGTFTDRTLKWGLDLRTVEGTSLSVVDLDGDGFLDVYAGTLNARNHLLLNAGGAGFVDVTPPRGSAAGGPDPLAGTIFWHTSTFGATFGDADLDGDLDLYTARWDDWSASGNRFWRCLGGTSFADETAAAGVYIGSFEYFAFTPTLVDMNGDRFPDLLVAADFGTSRYFANDGDGTFTERPGNGTGTDENGMGSTVGDYDNDGDLDWFVTSIYDDDGAEGFWGVTGNRLYRNDGDHRFTDVTDDAGVRDGGWGWGATFADLNHDGWLDLVMTNGFTNAAGTNPDRTFATDPTTVWIHRGDAARAGPTYVNATVASGLAHTGDGKGIVAFDYDRDGDLDLAISSTHQPLALWRNDRPVAGDDWLQLDLVPPPGNVPDGIGTRVEVSAGGRTYTRVVHAGMTYMSQEPLRVHVGFPSAPAVDVRLTWPDGSVRVLHDVPTGRRVWLVPGNVDLDGDVDEADLAAVVAGWGPCAGACPADVTRDGVVDVRDVLLVLAAWSG